MARTEPPATSLTPVGRSGALFDATGVYRYRLWRRWDEGPAACFIMLNPSTADADVDDPTIRRCLSFARAWGYAALDVVNLYAYRATNPKHLRAVSDPVGPENAMHMADAVASAGIVIAAWGGARGLTLPVIERELHCLAANRDGSPRHPLYVRGDALPIPFTQIQSSKSKPIPGSRSRSSARFT